MNRQERQYRAPDIQPASDEVCQVLSGILGNGVDVHRCLAAQALGRIGAPAAVQPLVAALLDEDEDVRADAAAALSDLGDPRAGRQLLENLIGDPCTEVKLAAIDALAKQQDIRIVPWLRRMVIARDEEIAWDEDEFYASGWDDWLDVQVKAVSALAALNAGEAVPDIVAAIRDEDAQDMTETAFKALAQMGRPGIDALGGFLGEESARVRRRAAAALAGSDADEAAEYLTRAFADPDAAVRLGALRAQAARQPADDRLAALFGDPDAIVRADTVRLCGRYHPDRLQDLLDDAEESVQVAALTALARLPDINADDRLTATLREKFSVGSAAVAAAAAEALAITAPQAAISDLTAVLEDRNGSTEIRLGALRGLAATGDAEAVEALVGVIDDTARAIRLEAMSALARLAGLDDDWPNAAGSALLSILTDDDQPEAGAGDKHQSAPAPPSEQKPEPAPSAEVGDGAGAYPTSTLQAILADTPEVEAALSLPDQGIELTPADMERLAIARRIKGKKRMPVRPTVVLHDDIRRFAARVLGDLNHADVAQGLALALTARDNDVRLAAADSLARIGQRLNPLPAATAQALLTADATAGQDEKRLLIRALSACEGDGIDDRLRAYLDDDDPYLRSEAIRALGKRRRVGPEIEPLLGDSDPTVRLSAAEAIAEAGGDKAVKLLVDFAFAFEGFHSRRAARLLRGLNTAQANAHFVDVLRDPDRTRTWSVAIEATGELNRSQPVQTLEGTNSERPD